MKKYILITVLLASASGVAFGVYSNSRAIKTAETQDPKKRAIEILSAVDKYYRSHPNYEVKVSHSLFSNYIDRVPYEKYDGYYKHFKDKEHSVLLGLETIINDGIKCVIDTNEHTVVISQIDKSDNNETREIEAALNMCSQVSVADSGNATLITLEFGSDRYPLSKLTVLVRKNRIMTVEMWHNETVSNEVGAEIKPRTLLQYSEYQEKKHIPNAEINLENIISGKGKSIKASSKYENYKIVDLRSNTK